MLAVKYVERGGGRAASPRPRPLRPQKLSHLTALANPTRACKKLLLWPIAQPVRGVTMPELPMFRHRRKHLVRCEAITPTAWCRLPCTTTTSVHTSSARRWSNARARRASRTSSPSSDGLRKRCMLLLRLDGWLALSCQSIAACEVVLDAMESVPTDAEPVPVPPAPLTGVAERRLASSREPADSIVGMRLTMPPSIAMGSSDGTSRPNPSIVM